MAELVEVRMGIAYQIDTECERQENLPSPACIRMRIRLKSIVAHSLTIIYILNITTIILSHINEGRGDQPKIALRLIELENSIELWFFVWVKKEISKLSYRTLFYACRHRCTLDSEKVGDLSIEIFTLFTHTHTHSLLLRVFYV